MQKTFHLILSVNKNINFGAIPVFVFNESEYGSVGAILNAASRYSAVLVENALEIALIAIAIKPAYV